MNELINSFTYWCAVIMFILLLLFYTSKREYKCGKNHYTAEVYCRFSCKTVLNYVWSNVKIRNIYLKHFADI